MFSYERGTPVKERRLLMPAREDRPARNDVCVMQLTPLKDVWERPEREDVGVMQVHPS